MSDNHDLPRPLSVLMPAYNEAATVARAVRQVAAHPRVGEILAIDDGSTDNTLARMRQLEREIERVRVLALPKNRGKGAAVQAGLKEACGPYFVIQDCDMEYRLDLWETMLQSLDDGADFVIGNRFGNGLVDFRFPLHAVFNIGFSFLLSRWWSLPVHDIECCTKMGRVADFRRDWQEEKFGIEVELIAAVARNHMQVREFRVPYHPRGYRQGKKIGWRDAIEAMQCAWKYRP